jgi:predicted ATPase/class 3 adenylate cyclase
VTFLFTDIEGSTARWEQQPEAMRAALARHDALLHAAISGRGGYVFKTVGDAFCAAFTTAPQALAAAVDAQRALSGEAWGELGAPRVRMALHTGAAEARDGDYFGPPLNRVARLLGAGHGGQVLLSQATWLLVCEQLPPGTGLREHGERRLRDLQQPERIFEVTIADRPLEFLPLRTLDSLPNNLSVQLTSFVGREREMAEIERLLGAVRLLTLVGTGGAGKTRLALQVAANVLERFPDGIWLVELAALSDVALVPHAVASALGLRDDTGRPLSTVLADHLRHRQLLLLLDNCEHLIAACAALVDTLLRACPGLRVLATSREALGIAGETIWRVPSLDLPDPRYLPSPERLTACGAVRLFADRAGAAVPGFALTSENAPAVAQICQRLDGIPLAIELAAARAKVLAPEQIAARLDDRFRLLTAGSRTALPRQQTLRALVDWSHELLSVTERIVFRRLAVFAGGWTLAAAERICADEGGEELDEFEVLDLLAQLVDKSLVLAEGHRGEARYGLLEMLRQYATEKLQAAGEVELMRRRHCDWFASFVGRQTARVNGPEQADAFAHLEAEHDNLRAALDWCEVEPGGWETAARLADELGWFWALRGHAREGRERLERIIVLATGRTAGRARALSQLGKLTHNGGDYERAAALLEESVSIWRELRDARGAATALARFGQLEQSRGDYERAWTLLEESQRLFQSVGGESGLDAPVAVFLAQLAKDRGDYERAILLFDACLVSARGQGDRHAESSILRSLGELMQLRSSTREAAAHLKESLLLIRDLDDRSCAVTTLDSLAVLVAQDDPARAVRLFAAAEASRQVPGWSVSPADRERLTAATAAAQARLDPAVSDAAWAEGQAMRLEDAVAYALAGLESY